MREARKRQRFEALARPELDALFRTSWRMVGRHAVAEEIVQEACLRAYASYDPADEPAQFRPWIFRIAINLALDHLRRPRREVAWAHDAESDGNLVADGSLAGQPHAVAEGREVGRAITAALADLSVELRSVAVLVLIEEMSYSEAATALAITEDLVRSRLSRARGELRKSLAKHGADLAPQATSINLPSTKRGSP